MGIDKYRKLLGFVFVILLIVALYAFTPLKDVLSRENMEGLRLWIEGQGVLAPFVFLFLYIAATIFCLPGSALTILAGLIFGVMRGFFWVVIASNVGALCAFLISRYLGRQAAEKILRGHLARLDKSVGAHGFYVVLWLRLIPIFPFNVLNYALGLTKVGIRDYVFADILGMIPGTFAYVSLGNAASRISFSDPAVWGQVEVWGPFVLVVFLSLLPKIFRKKSKELEKYGKETS